MRSLRLSALALALLLAVGLFNGAYLTRRCTAWTAQLDAVTAAVAQGDWDGAEDGMAALAHSWQQHRTYLSMTLPHDEIDVADTALHQCADHVSARDGAALAGTALLLRLQLRELAEREQLRFGNIL